MGQGSFSARCTGLDVIIDEIRGKTLGKLSFYSATKKIVSYGKICF